VLGLQKLIATIILLSEKQLTCNKEGTYFAELSNSFDKFFSLFKAKNGYGHLDTAKYL